MNTEGTQDITNKENKNKIIISRLYGKKKEKRVMKRSKENHINVDSYEEEERKEN